MPLVTYTVTATYDLPAADLATSMHNLRTGIYAALDSLAVVLGGVEFTCDVGAPTFDATTIAFLPAAANRTTPTDHTKPTRI